MPSRISATSESRMGRPLRWPMTMVLNCSTASGFPEIRRGYSAPFRFRRPSGVLTFSDWRPAITSSTPMPRASRRVGIDVDIDLPLRFADQIHLAHPGDVFESPLDLFFDESG